MNKPMHYLKLATIAIAALVSLASADTVQLWPTGTPGIDPSIPESSMRNSFINNIHNPTLSIHRPAKPNGCAVVICPGGGYSGLSIVNEGTQVAEFLNSKGIVAFVLKYRLPSTPGVDFKDPVPLSDALRAIQWVRHHAADFGINPTRIGIMGFSAGGHLAASAGTRYALGSKFGTDAIAKTPARPDFMVLVYPVISTDKAIAHICPKHLLPAGASPEALAAQSVETLVTSETPPAFLAHAKNDSVVVPQNSEVMHQALEKAGILSSLNFYEQGGHGFGLGKPAQDSSQWPSALIEWLKSRRFI